MILGSRLSETEANDFNLPADTPKDSFGNSLYTGEDHLKILKHFWRRVFCRTSLQLDMKKLEQFFIHYDPSKWDWSKAPGFDRALVEAYVMHLKHTGTGKDGIHNYCYKFGTKHVIDFLVFLFQAFTAEPGSGPILPSDINDGLFCYPDEK